MTNLRDPFDKTFDKGGFTYVQWSQVADRLDEVIEGGWSFSILQLGPEWAHGRLTIGDRHFENVGYAENAEADWKKEPYKDAVSDAFKRCAALAGVARYLYDKGDAQHSTRGAGRVTPPPARPVARSSTDVPEFAPDEWKVTPIGSGDNNECPEHGVTWNGQWGDLWHKTADGAYCRHPENIPRGPRKAGAAR